MDSSGSFFYVEYMRTIFLKYIGSVFLLTGIIFTGCTETAVITPIKVHSVPDTKVAFDSFVNFDYKKRRSLPGWQTTKTSIEKTLGLWYDQVNVRQDIANGTPTDLKSFLLALPGPEECDISVVYLGSIQDDLANWEFVNGEIANWYNLLAEENLPEHPCRIVIFDSCHSAVVRNIPSWSQRFASVTLFASSASEVTYQFYPSALLPVDVQKRFPSAWAWAQSYMPVEWSKNISFLGLIWIETVSNINLAPADKIEWTEFFKSCSQNSENFRLIMGSRWGSTVHVFVK